MSLLLAPYNNAMRLGQGFNSYTQQICIDDAVIIDQAREENVLNNFGLTMKMLAEQTGTISALERIPGLVESDIKTSTTPLAHAQLPPTTDSLAPGPNDSASFSFKTGGGAGASSSAPPRKPAAKAPTAEERKAQGQKNLDSAAAANADAMSVGEMQDKFDTNKTRIDELLEQNTQSVKQEEGHIQLPWSAEEAEGPGQIVTYSSKFVNKLSEVTDEMSISGSLSIKYGGIGGSGSGAFFDAEKFYDSDLKYLVSVKVTFADTFISGFLEGGEFNALVLIKVHNKNKKRDIQAEAKVALTAGPVEVAAQGNVKLAEENITNNSETSVYVRWCGGGNITPYGAEWNIKSAMAAAARFPALVSLFPQRTHAILSKYRSLRSFLLLQPVQLSPLRYELAQLYTNMLLDAFMEYKSLSKRISGQIGDIQAGLKQFLPVDVSMRPNRSSGLIAADLTFFPATLTGLDEARRAIRSQMNMIIAEVDELTDHPELGSDPKRVQKWVGPSSFSILLPEVDLRNTRKRTNHAPLAVTRINTVDKPEEAPTDDSDVDAPPLFNPNSCLLRPSSAEQGKLADLQWQSYGIGASYQVSPPVGDQDRGQPFCTLDFAQSDESITEITAIVDDQKRLTSLVLGYSNGLICTFGAPVDQLDVDSALQIHKLELLDPAIHRILAGQIQVLTYSDSNSELKQRVVGLSIGISDTKKLETFYTPSDVETGKVEKHHFGVPASGLKLAGLWGRMQEDGLEPCITRLGFVWGSVSAGTDTSGDQNGRPKTITSVSRSLWPKTRENNVLNEVKFPYTLLGEPRLLLAPHYLKSAAKDKDSRDTESMERLVFSARATPKKVDEKGFELEARVRHGEDALFVNWMVLPEFESARMESGEVELAGSTRQTYQEAPIGFARPFPADMTPDIRCWITTITAYADQPGGTLHVKASVVPDSYTSTGFRLAVNSFSETKIEKISLGWIAHAKPAKSNADFVSGDLLVDKWEDGKKKIDLGTTLTDKPVSQFVGINELEASTSNLISVAATFLPETSKEAVYLNVCTFGPSQVKKVGLAWIVSM
ncbi:unnamed protein product [Tilletia controversa]|nr:unnamed protein product [Tilletia controversa]CAD6924556.1 unnamed protein product [Tilletia controversa]CAD6928111.1 unnamed protein product [Tilletia controversa]